MSVILLSRPTNEWHIY